MTFIRRHLDPASRLGEVVFGMIMTLCFTGAVRLGLEEADSRALFVDILGCNLAWAVVDAVLYVIAEVFERGRKFRLAREVTGTTSEDAALARIGAELDGPLLALTSEEERVQLHRWVLAALRRSIPEGGAGLRAQDLLGGLAVALTLLLATFPVVVPFLLVKDPSVAVRASNLVALGMLFLLGVRWGQTVAGRPLRYGAGLTAVGLVLVLITIGLGG
jgi:VIT1/CCC1 family predicted Fe2+/Mn2+ transporter